MNIDTNTLIFIALAIMMILIVICFICNSINSSKINRTQTAGRIERVEGDKTSEFFNLVIKNSINVINFFYFETKP